MEGLLVILTGIIGLCIILFMVTINVKTLLNLLIYLPVFMSLIVLGGWSMLRIAGIPFAYLFWYGYMAIIIIWLTVHKKRIVAPLHGTLHLFIFLMYIFCSLFWVVHFNSWFVYFSSWVLNAILVYFASYNLVIHAVKSRADLTRLVRSYKYSLLAISSMALAKYFILGYSEANPIDLLERNSIPMLVIPMYAIVFSEYLHNRKSTKNPINGINIFFILTPVVFLFFLYSRTGYMGLFFVIAFNIMLTFKASNVIKTIRVLSKKILIPTTLLIILSVTSISVVDNFEFTQIEMVLNRLESTRDTFIGQLEGTIEQGESGYRRQILMDANREIRKNRPILGTGLGLENYLHYMPSFVTTRHAKPHNLYFSLLGELGIVGFLLFMMFTLKYFLMNYKKIGLIQDKEMVHTLNGFYVGALAFMVMFLGNEFIHFPVVWIHLGITAALARIVGEIC